MQNISEEKISVEYSNFKEKYDSQFYNDYRIINQFKILKSGIESLYDNKKYSEASRYMKKFDEYVSSITEGMGTPSEAENVHAGIKKLDNLLKEYLSDLERDIKADLDSLEERKDIDKDKLETVRGLFKNRNYSNLQDKLDALNRCKESLHELELGEDAINIEEKLSEAQYGNEYLEVKRKNEARSEIAYWYQNEISYDTVLELSLDNANNREKMWSDLQKATEYEIGWTQNNIKSASTKYESQITYETTESISDDVYYYHVMQNDLDLSNRQILSENESKQDIVSQISNCQNMIDSLELYTQHESKRQVSEQVKSDIDILQKRLIDIKKQYQEVTAKIDELNSDVKKRIEEFNETININKDEERTQALTKVEEKPGIFKKLANFFKARVRK